MHQLIDGIRCFSLWPSGVDNLAPIDTGTPGFMRCPTGGEKANFGGLLGGVTAANLNV